MKQKELPLLGQILEKVAPLIGAQVFVEPEWGIVGQITFKNGHRSYFKYNTLNFNHVGSAEVVKDKDYAHFFMQSMGYPVVPGSKTFYSKEWGEAIGVTDRGESAALAYAEALGWPVVVKPNSGSQGNAVFVVHNHNQFSHAIDTVFKNDRVALVQSLVKGRDYRIVVLDDEVVAAYERVPLNVIGDGTSTIADLLEEKQKNFLAVSRDVGIKRDDPRIALKLSQLQRSFVSIPDKGEQLFLLDNANLSSGGDAVDVTASIHPEYKKIALSLTRDMGLRLAGVDLMVETDITEPPGVYFVLEVNASPGLNHFAQLGNAQKEIVENLYLEILKKIEQEH